MYQRNPPAARVWLFAISTLMASTPSSAIITSNSGLYVNDFLGANRFYEAGFDGSGAIIAHIEGGIPWNGHVTLSHVVPTPELVGTGALGEVDRHSTWVAQSMVGRGNSPQDVGISPGATLWGGAIAVTWNGTRYSRNWSDTAPSTLSPYKTAMVTGINGVTADVVNSSWGFLNPSGIFGETVGFDAYAYTSGKLAVVSAGNNGPEESTVGGLGAGYNSITSAALGSDGGANPYSTPSNFTSPGPSFYWQPVTSTTGQFSPMLRASVDLAAPGQNLRLAYYGGQSGGNRPELGGSPGGSAGTPTTFSNNVAGTSFSAPITAAGAALVIGAGKTVFSDNPAAIDGRVIKSILMNSADKTVGWDNGQALVDRDDLSSIKAATLLPPAGPVLPLSAFTGDNAPESFAGFLDEHGWESQTTSYLASSSSGNVIATTQSLDWTVGTGRLNLDTAFDQYFAGTADVAGLGGGAIQTIGWDFGELSGPGAFNDYYFDDALLGGSTISVTLNWFVNRAISDDYAIVEELKFADLDLEVWSVIDGVATDLVATSFSVVNNVEHLYFELPASMDYLLRVQYVGDNYNFLGGINSEVYGLAWSATAVPEVSSIGLILATFPVVVWRIRRSRRRA